MSLNDKLKEIDRLRQTIEQHGKLSDETLRKINYKFRLEWNYYSNRMEGNTLTLEETKSVMLGNVNVHDKPLKDVLEIKGHDEAIGSIIRMGKGELNISETRIRELHKGIMYEDDPAEKEKIGKWKTVPNHILNYKGEKFDFSDPAEVPEAMHALINWLNVEKEKIERKNANALHPALLSFMFHLKYLTIHPFYDGNGRTGRILMNLILISYGFPPIYIKEQEKESYYRYLAEVQGYGADEEALFKLMADLLIRSLKIVLDAAEGKEIEEPSDWEKRLNLLKKQLATEGDIQIVRSVDAVLNIIHESIFPFLEKVMHKLAQFEDLFAERRIEFGGNSGRFAIRDLENAKTHLLRMNDQFMRNINFHYGLNGFKKAGTNTFSTSIDLRWRFSSYKYYFFFDNMNEQEALVKLYHQNFTEAESEAFSNECAKRLLDKIEAQLAK